MKDSLLWLSVFESCPDPVIVTLAMKILMANTPARQLFGLPIDPERYPGWDSLIHPFDNPKESYHEDQTLVSLFGNLSDHLYRLRSRPYVSEDIEYTVHTLTPVFSGSMLPSEDDETGKLLELIISQAPIGISVRDKNGTLIFNNDAWQNLWKLSDEEVLEKKQARAVLNLDDKDDYLSTYRDQLMEVYSKGTHFTIPELQLRKPRPGKAEWISQHFYGLKDVSGEVRRVVVLTEDITALKKAREQRTELERQLLHSQKLESLGILAGGIAHDFNNLLVAILGNLEIALFDISPMSPARPNIMEALAAVQKASDLTRQMLAYSGKGRFQLTEVDIGDLVRENLHLLKAAVPGIVELNLRLASNLPPIIADPGQIQQVVMNLITNAAEAVGEILGSIYLTTTVKILTDRDIALSRIDEKPKPGLFVCIEVYDTGCGMSRDVMAQMFDPFFTTKFTGRGLGMSAILGIVRAHEGVITVESAPGEGTCIRVCFPVPKSHQRKKDKTHAKTTSDGAIKKEVRKQGSILVIDDEPPVRMMIESMVERYGLNIMTAVNGEEGIRVFSKHHPDIIGIILDLSMPRTDVVAILRTLQSIDPQVPIVLASGYSESEAQQNMPGIRVFGFLQKPFHLKQLWNLFDQFVAQKKP